MFCCGGGPTYYIIHGLANAESGDNIYMLLSSPDDWSGQLVKWNSTTEVKTVLVSYSAYDKILCHLRAYGDRLYVLYYDYSTSNAFIRIYTTAGVLVETIDTCTLAEIRTGEEDKLVYPLKLAIYDEENIYVLTSGGVGEDNVFWFLKSGGSWSNPLSFCPTGDFSISAIYCIETTRENYIYLSGVKSSKKVIRWYNRTTGVFVGTQEITDYIREMYYNG